MRDEKAQAVIGQGVESRCAFLLHSVLWNDEILEIRQDVFSQGADSGKTKGKGKGDQDNKFSGTRQGRSEPNKTRNFRGARDVQRV